MLPPPDASFSVHEIVYHAAVSLRTIRHYVAEKIVPAPEFRSSRTRYDRMFIVRLRAARALRRRGLTLSAIRDQLDLMPADEMIRLAGYALPAPDPIPAAVSTKRPPVSTRNGSGDAQVSTRSGRSPMPTMPSPSLPTGFLGPYRPSPTAPREQWEHFEICPGVKLLVRTEADSESWRVAREMLALFGSTVDIVERINPP
jgi:DNA-binding transcriptional MerR regulator